MIDIDPPAMRALLQAGVSIRNQYFSDPDDPVSALRGPAPEARIAALETSLGFELPPDYRLFLSLSDGWDFVDAHVSLMGCEEISRKKREDTFAQWFRDMWRPELEYPQTRFVIGTSDITLARYLLVLPDDSAPPPETAPDPTAWNIMYVSPDTDFTYDSFVDYLRESEATYRELVAGEHQ